MSNPTPLADAHPPDLTAALEALFGLRDPEGLPALVERHPVLLSERVEQMLAAVEQQHPDAGVRSVAAVYGTLLRSGRRRGVQAAVDEFLALRGLVQHLSPSPPPPPAPERGGPGGTLRTLAGRLASRLARPGRDDADEGRAAEVAFDLFASLEAWAAARRVVAGAPVLLDGRRRPAFAARVARLPVGSVAREVAEQRLAVLDDCRRVGVEAAFVDVAARLAAKAGALLDRRGEGGHPLDLEAAIAGLVDALDVQPADGRLRARCASDLGRAYAARFDELGDPADVDRALATFDLAVTMARDTAAQAPALVARGRAFATRFDASGDPRDLDSAIADLEAAGGLPDVDDHERALAATALATALRTRFEQAAGRSPDPDPEVLRRSVALARAALPHLPEPVERREALLTLARSLVLGYDRWRNPTDLRVAVAALGEAYPLAAPGSAAAADVLAETGAAHEAAYRAGGQPEALDAAVAARRRAWGEVGQQLAIAPLTYQLGIQARWQPVARRLVADLLERAERRPAGAADDRREAFEAAVGAKSRLLADAVGRALPAPPSAPDDLRGLERDLSGRMQRFRAEELAWRRAKGGPSHAARLAWLREQEETGFRLRSLVLQIGQRSDPASAAWADLRRGVPLTAEGVEGWVAAAGAGYLLVSLLPTENPATGEAETSLILLGGEGLSAERVPLGPADWDAVWDTFEHEVHQFRPSRPTETTWPARLRPLTAAIERHLAGVRQVVLEPFGRAHLLPWATLARLADWRQASGEPVGVSVLPSLGLLAAAVAPRPPAEGTAVVVGNDWDPALSSGEEARMVAARLGTDALLGPAATWAEVEARLPGARVVHLATHARFDPASPLESAIDLYDRPAAVADLVRLRLSADLVVLSACETGVAAGIGGDELAGFTTALLLGGARRLVVTLWPVPDWAARLFAERFYGAWPGEGSVERAFTAATAALYADPLLGRHPRYWGAFALVGVD